MTVAEVVRHALTTLTAGDGVRAVRVAPTGPQAPSEEDDDGAGLAVVLDLTPLLARRRVALER